MVNKNPKKDAKLALLDAAISLFRAKGYTATRVDDLCREAQVTKGSFFHYFETKEALAVAAAAHWSVTTENFFNQAPYHQHPDPLDRVIGYIAFRKQLLTGECQSFTCLAGTLVQEMYQESPALKKACHASIFNHAATLESDIQSAKDHYIPSATWTASSIALHTQAVIQGAFILAKATGSAAIAADSIDHLKRYIQLLFGTHLAVAEPSTIQHRNGVH